MAQIRICGKRFLTFAHAKLSARPPRPDSKNKNTSPAQIAKKKPCLPPKQQKKEHAPRPNSKTKHGPGPNSKKKHAPRPNSRKKKPTTRPNRNRKKKKKRSEGAGACLFFCCLGGGRVLFFCCLSGAWAPAQPAKKNTHPPKQQKI